MIDGRGFTEALHVCFGSFSTELRCSRDVRFTVISGHLWAVLVAAPLFADLSERILTYRSAQTRSALDPSDSIIFFYIASRARVYASATS
jgi:hypothetical protein